MSSFMFRSVSELRRGSEPVDSVDSGLFHHDQSELSVKPSDQTLHLAPTKEEKANRRESKCSQVDSPSQKGRESKSTTKENKADKKRRESKSSKYTPTSNKSIARTISTRFGSPDHREEEKEKRKVSESTDDSAYSPPRCRWCLEYIQAYLPRIPHLSYCNPAYIEWNNKFLEQAKNDFTYKYETPHCQHLKKVTLFDFNIVKVLGAGAFGRVLLVKYYANEKDRRASKAGRVTRSSSVDVDVNGAPFHYYAIKVLEKQEIVKLRQVEGTIEEKKILQAIKFPTLIEMAFAFKDNANLYMVLEYAEGGDIFKNLSKVKRFTENQARFFASQIILGFEYLHHLDIVHRDLKPENALIDGKGFCKLTDFGFAKICKGRTWTLCGTPEYLAPEILLSKGYGKSVDWWATGIFIYEMVAGKSPFYHENEMRLFENILGGEFRFPKRFSLALRDLLRKIIQVDISKRYGCMLAGADDIKQHRWFSKTDWKAVYDRNVPVPYKPRYKRPENTQKTIEYGEAKIATSQMELCSEHFEEF